MCKRHGHEHPIVAFHHHNFLIFYYNLQRLLTDRSNVHKTQLIYCSHISPYKTQPQIQKTEKTQQSVKKVPQETNTQSDKKHLENKPQKTDSKKKSGRAEKT